MLILVVVFNEWWHSRLLMVRRHFFRIGWVLSNLIRVLNLLEDSPYITPFENLILKSTIFIGVHLGNSHLVYRWVIQFIEQMRMKEWCQEPSQAVVIDLSSVGIIIFDLYASPSNLTKYFNLQLAQVSPNTSTWIPTRLHIQCWTL